MDYNFPFFERTNSLVLEYLYYFPLNYQQIIESNSDFIVKFRHNIRC
jgi:hypothetical protein